MNWIFAGYSGSKNSVQTRKKKFGRNFADGIPEGVNSKSQ
jgi:hypothetical protein